MHQGGSNERKETALMKGKASKKRCWAGQERVHISRLTGGRHLSQSD